MAADRVEQQQQQRLDLTGKQNTPPNLYRRSGQTRSSAVPCSAAMRPGAGGEGLMYVSDGE